MVSHLRYLISKRCILSSGKITMPLRESSSPFLFVIKVNENKSSGQNYDLHMHVPYKKKKKKKKGRKKELQKLFPLWPFYNQIVLCNDKWYFFLNTKKKSLHYILDRHHFVQYFCLLWIIWICCTVLFNFLVCLCFPVFL